MAGLSQPSAQSPALTPPVGPQYQQSPWTAAQSRAQFAALAKLRGAIFLNSFRRKGGAGELVARLIFLPIFGIFALGPIAASCFLAHLFVSDDRISMLAILTWSIFGLWLVVLLNISPPGLSFDINTILRFPLSFPRYLTARIFFGLLSVSTVIGTLCLIAADLGIALARSSLALWSTLVLAIFALANIFFTRMMLVWVERWLSTRRAREILTALILFGSLGFQYININFNPGLQSRHHHVPNHLPLLLSIFHHIEPFAAVLPPGLAAASIVSFSEGRLLAALAALLGLIAFTALFFSVFAWRMHREFLGENLSEVTQPNQTPARRSTAAALPNPTPTSPALTPDTVPLATTHARTFGLSSTVIACLRKEFLYLQRNLNQLYGFIAPLFMVFLFANLMSASGRFGELVFPVAIAYSTIGVSTLSYNALGMDGTGVQFYFLSPTRLRDVFLAKNLTMFLLTLAELVLIFAVIVLVTHAPSLVIALATVAWLLFATFFNAAVGNLRSIIAPRKVDLMKASRKQISQLSALLALGMVIVCAALGAAVVSLCTYFDRPWLMVPIFLAFAVAAFIFYLQVLGRLDALALTHRDTLTEELCKS
jgi:ABC-2 type transport system permease protein